MRSINRTTTIWCDFGPKSCKFKSERQVGFGVGPIFRRKSHRKSIHSSPATGAGNGFLSHLRRWMSLLKKTQQSIHNATKKRGVPDSTNILLLQCLSHPGTYGAFFHHEHRSMSFEAWSTRAAWPHSCWTRSTAAIRWLLRSWELGVFSPGFA